MWWEFCAEANFTSRLCYQLKEIYKKLLSAKSHTRCISASNIDLILLITTNNVVRFKIDWLIQELSKLLFTPSLYFPKKCHPMSNLIIDLFLNNLQNAMWANKSKLTKTIVFRLHSVHRWAIHTCTHLQS